MKGYYSFIIPFIAFTILILFACEEYLFEDMDLVVHPNSIQTEFKIDTALKGEYFYTDTVQTLDTLTPLIENQYENASLKSIHLIEASLEISNNTGTQSFDAFDYFQVFMCADNQNDIIIATLPVIPDSIAMIELLVEEDVDIYNYVISDEYIIKVKAILNQDIKSTMTVLGNWNYQMIIDD